MQKAIAVVLLCGLVACADRQAVADRDAAKAQVRQLETDGNASEALLKEAHEKLLAAEVEVKRSKVASVTGPVRGG